MSLKPHHIDLLRAVCNRGSMPAAEIDGRELRPLLRLDLVVDDNATIRATEKGRSTVRGDHPPPGVAAGHTRARLARPPVTESTQPPVPNSGKLSESQERVLRYLLRQTGPVPADHLDQRVLRALLSRGLIEESRGWVNPTDLANPFLQSHATKIRARNLRHAGSSPRRARAEAILRAAVALEGALPKGAEIMIANVPAYGDDVVAGLREIVRRMG